MAAGKVRVFHCFNNSQAKSALEIHSNLDPRKVESTYYLDETFQPDDFEKRIGRDIDSADHFLLYLGSDLFGDVQTKEVERALAREKDRGRELIAVIYLDNVERETERLKEELDKRFGEEGLALLRRSAVLMPNGVPDDRQIEQLQEWVFGENVWGDLARSVRSLIRKAIAWSEQAASAAFLDKDEIEQADRLLESHPRFCNRDLVLLYLAACRRRLARRKVTVGAAAAAVLVAIVLGGLATKANIDAAADLDLRRKKPQEMTESEQAIVKEACTALKSAPEAPLRPYPQIAGARPAHAPASIGKMCALLFETLTDQQNRDMAEDPWQEFLEGTPADVLNGLKADALGDVDGGIRWIFRDGGAKSTYVSARTYRSRSQLFWHTPPEVEPYEAYFIVQGHNLNAMCRALLVGRQTVNNIICSMEPGDDGLFPQHMP